MFLDVLFFEHPEYINVGHAQKERSSEWEIGKATHMYLGTQNSCVSKSNARERKKHRCASATGTPESFSFLFSPCLTKSPIQAEHVHHFGSGNVPSATGPGLADRSRPAVGARFVECQQWHSCQGFELQPMDLTVFHRSVR